MSLEGKAAGQRLVGRINSVDTLIIDAYAIAVKNGFAGTEEEWLASLKGEKGDKGAVDFEELTDEEIAILKGDPGVSCTHAWNGTVLEVTSASGTSSADLKGEKGDKGDKGDSIKGEKGDPGTGVTILGSYNTEAELKAAHSSGKEGDSYLVSGNLYVWVGNEWSNVGNIQGPVGKTAYEYAKEGGYTGSEVEFAAKLAEETVAKKNQGEGQIIAGANNATWYRFAVTTEGNLRVDVSTNQGATWATSHYLPKTMNGGSGATPVITSSGRTGSVAVNNGNSPANGAGLWVYGNDHATENNRGKFRLQVYDEATSTYRQLDGSPDGLLKWNGYDIPTGKASVNAADYERKTAKLTADGFYSIVATQWDDFPFNGAMLVYRYSYNYVVQVAVATADHRVMTRIVHRTTFAVFRDWASPADSAEAKIPNHYSDFDTFYVNKDTGSDSNDGKTAKTAFASIEKAFEQANEGHVNLVIYVTGAGTYQFSKHVFASMTIHIKNISGGAVTLEQSTPGLTVFYDMHINSNGINWRGYYDNEAATPEEKWNDLYFEGCTVAMQNGDVMPHLKLIGGHVVATNVTCGGLNLSYCPAKLNGITINAVDGANTSTAGNVGVYGMMSDIYCLDEITFQGEKVLNRLYQINNCELYMQDDTIGDVLAEGAMNTFLASTIYCTDAIKNKLATLQGCTLSSTDCIWECEYEDM